MIPPRYSTCDLHYGYGDGSRQVIYSGRPVSSMGLLIVREIQRDIWTSGEDLWA